MLYRVEIENFASIRETQVLDLRIGAKVAVDRNRHAEIFPQAGVFVPKVIAIFGANASGKTNLLKALDFIIGMAMRQPSPIPVCLPFNSIETHQKPTRIVIEFGDKINLLEPDQDVFGVFRYELAVSGLQVEGPTIESESLKMRPLAEGKWQRVFERDSERKVLGSNVFPMKGYGHLVKALRPNATVISSFAFFDHPSAKHFAEAAERVITVANSLRTSDEQSLHKFLSSQPDSLQRLNSHLARIDFGLQAMRYVTDSDGPKPLFKHFGMPEEMNWRLESNGTRSFIMLFPLIQQALQSGGLCLIDEMDATIHPLLLPEILRWFYDYENSNPMNSQLWFTSHAPTLLEGLKKEEVVVCEKDKEGRTRVYSLMDVKIRRDDNLYRKYLDGALGGVPLLG